MRNTRVKSKNAIIAIRVQVLAGKTDSATSAKISGGNDSSKSTVRDKTESIQPRRAAAKIPPAPPTKKESKVAAKAMKIVSRAPNKRRVNISRPRLSVPSQKRADAGSQTSPANSDWP